MCIKFITWWWISSEYAGVPISTVILRLSNVWKIIHSPDWKHLSFFCRWLDVLKIHKITLQWLILTTYRCRHDFNTFLDNCNNKRLLLSGKNAANSREKRKDEAARDIQMNSTHLIQMKQNQTTNFWNVTQKLSQL